MAEQIIQYKSLSDVEVVTDLDSSDMQLIERKGAYRRAKADMLSIDANIEVDTTLTQANQAADSLTVGKKFQAIESNMEMLTSDIDDIDSIAQAAVNKAEEASNGLKHAVKTVNGNAPDDNGNVAITIQSTGDGTQIDTSLSISGAAADAKVVGDKISAMEETMLTQTDIPQVLPNPYMLTINGTPYDGSALVSVTTAQTVNGVAPDESGNITIAFTAGGEGTGIMSVIQTTTSEEDDGINIVTVTLTNGETSSFAVQNGSKGSKGDKGDAPVKGADYWTDEDKSSIINDVLAALPAAEGVSF